MKKEYLILVALIMILCAYLLFHKENKNNYVLPEITKIDITKITGLIIEKKGNPVEFIKKEKAWVVSDKKYPAESSSIEKMLDTLKKFKLSALVSEKEDLKRYDLDDENLILVKAMNGQKKVFEFTMGKTAPSFNHTFIRLTADKNIYHANGNFRSYFDKTLEDFRDKKVVEFKKNSINQIFIEKQGLSKTLVSRKGKKAGSINWRYDDGASADKEIISNLLSAVSFLKCEKYLSDNTKTKFEKEKPLYKIHLKNKGDINLSLFKTDSQDNLIGISSMNEYAFELSQFNAKEIQSNIEKLLGIVKKEENKD
ncbi:MAG: DUF4340 domain-containing protein [Desulfobacula sp.]|jgi:hypothetical protein|uniref:DUF4340 domain-containing protein n=1 Tax=Desulfobacula sp. TaxID=2593537 RepID=UPI001E10A7D5|nr:DUF4340 domain-containing protein [Desulfobacula sp.]MBT3483826.1 DUF4340 domain-containing protein [Desulfobacula sp.]MBT3803014.1 DUF4340 domain-containing protein [Desulfobacula sp.]MBT4023473.1 DUF4340 domain-containing protein [Desulfobacula sp.]MBT4197062.1 DUF4340 domain-containing protein [Desulfobacula sp.]